MIFTKLHAIVVCSMLNAHCRVHVRVGIALGGTSLKRRRIALGKKKQKFANTLFECTHVRDVIYYVVVRIAISTRTSDENSRY